MKASTLLRRLAPFAVAAAIVAVPATAQAEDTTNVEINPGNVPTTAVGFEDQSCDQVPDDVADGEDGWVFVLPGSAGNDAEFVSVTATFEDADGMQQVYTTDANGGIDGGPGTSKAYIITPAGWTLIGATGEATGVTGKAQFNLTHTCPGEPGSEPSPSDSPSETPSETPTDMQPTSPGETPTDDMTDQPSTSPAGDDGTLPVTGTALTTVLLTGVALAGAGAAMQMMRRRRAAGERTWGDDE